MEGEHLEETDQKLPGRLSGNAADTANTSVHAAKLDSRPCSLHQLWYSTYQMIAQANKANQKGIGWLDLATAKLTSNRSAPAALATGACSCSCSCTTRLAMGRPSASMSADGWADHVSSSSSSSLLSSETSGPCPLLHGSLRSVQSNRGYRGNAKLWFSPTCRSRIPGTLCPRDHC
eukprot:scaffold259170_cov21-Tisochrysis_lutea.AAC.2